MRPASFFIDNKTSEPILSLVILCTGAVAATGQPRTAGVMQEGLQNAQLRPVLKPGARLLFFAPSTPIEEAKLGGWASSVPGQNTIKSVARWFGGLSSVDISIDSIIFANGEVDGPDREGFMQELGNRKRAADSVVAAIRAGDAAALTAMSVEPIQSGDGHFSGWQKRFAARYLSSSDPSWRALQLRGLQGYPTPPPLFRRPASSHD